MKNLIMTVAVAGTMLFATQAVTAQEETGTETTMEQTTQSQDQDYKEITTDKLPAPVTKAVETDFAGATVSKAYINEKKEYKLVLETEAGAEPQTVYANAQGEWIEPKESE